MRNKFYIMCFRFWDLIKPRCLCICKWIKKNANVDVLSKIVTILTFPAMVFAIFSGITQIKLLENQVFVSNSISIAQIGDHCMWNTQHGGNYDSYLLLKEMEVDPINKNIADAIRNQIKRVEKKYKSTDVMIDYAKRLPAIMKYGSREWAYIDTVNIDNIFNHMERQLETENIKAAYFMSGVTTERLKESDKTWEDVFDSLILSIGNDTWCLYGRKMALMAYCKLAEIEFSGVFDFEKAIEDWESRKQEILKKKGI